MLKDLAKKAYNAYGEAAEWKNFQGNMMPAWNALPEKIVGQWMEAVRAVQNALVKGIPEDQNLAKDVYEAYCCSVNWKNVDGDYLEVWDKLPKLNVDRYHKMVEAAQEVLAQRIAGSSVGDDKLVRKFYYAYCNLVEWVGSDGNPMPSWDELPEDDVMRWEKMLDAVSEVLTGKVKPLFGQVLEVKGVESGSFSKDGLHLIQNFYF